MPGCQLLQINHSPDKKGSDPSLCTRLCVCMQGITRKSLTRLQPGKVMAGEGRVYQRHPTSVSPGSATPSEISTSIYEAIWEITRHLLHWKQKRFFATHSKQGTAANVTPAPPRQLSEGLVTKSLSHKGRVDSGGAAGYNGGFGKWKHCHT